MLLLVFSLCVHSNCVYSDSSACTGEGHGRARGGGARTRLAHMTCCLYVPRLRRGRRVRTLLVGFHEPRYINARISAPSASDKLNALRRTHLIHV